MASNRSGRISGGQLCELHVTRGTGSSEEPSVQTHCKQLPDSWGRTAPMEYDLPAFLLRITCVNVKLIVAEPLISFIMLKKSH